jgi:hypothetical protein
MQRSFFAAIYKVNTIAFGRQGQFFAQILPEFSSHAAAFGELHQQCETFFCRKKRNE